MKVNINTKFLYTALTTVLLTGNAMASDNDFNKAMEEFNRATAQARADEPDWAQDATNNVLGDLGGLMGLLGNINMRAEGGAIDMAAMQAQIDAFSANMLGSIAGLQKQAEAAADVERQANPALAALHNDLLLAVGQNNQIQVQNILEGMKEFSVSHITANTDVIQKACLQARESKFYPLIECMLLSADKVVARRDYATGLITGFFAKASEFQDYACIDFMLKSKVPFVAGDLDSALYRACEKCNLPLMQVLMNGFEANNFKTSTFGLTSFLNMLRPFAKEPRGIEARQYLLRNADRQFGVSQFDMDDYLKALFSLALETGETDLLEACLNRGADSELPNPGPYDVDSLYYEYMDKTNQQGFIEMANNTPLMNVLFNRTENQSRLNGYNVSAIMRRAGEYGLVEFIRSMIERDPRYVRPTVDDLRAARDQVQQSGHQAVVDYLTPFLPAVPAANVAPYIGRGAAAIDVGGCLGVHNYATSPVMVAESSNKSIKLLDAVLLKVTERCKSIANKDYLNFDASCVELFNWINTFVPEAEQETARNAAFFKLESDSDYEQVLTLTVNYLKAYHPEGIEVWIAAFIRESISAYNGSNGVSCDRGIRERVAVGLRGIDSDLDKLFIQVEGPAMMANSIKKWNPAGSPAEVARHLIEGGLKANATAEDAVEKFKQLFFADVKENGLSMDDYTDVMEAIAEGLIDNFEQISAVLKKAE